jgi:tRNA-uridine 2-sulfurtransferase
MKKRVLVAMSGGVDSSVAAALLKKDGFEAIGVTMCFDLTASKSRRRPACCSLQAITDARRVCDKLDMPHYTLNMRKALEDYVIKDFCDEYLHGRTPNPCVRCNQFLKFGVLLQKALAFKADFLATGHYARIIRQSDYLLRKARDIRKDQSYFLYRLNQKQLKHVFFPLGDYTKEKVRQLAKEFGLPVADKIASQEICFLPDNDYRSFLKARIKKSFKPGPVRDTQGNILGEHKGIALYTVGQREGLGIAKGYPLYITNLDYRRNEITVGRKEEVFKSRLLLKEAYFACEEPKKKVALMLRIRYNHKEAPAQVRPVKNKIEISFLKPQFAVTPGQSAVFYKRDIVLGGGIIERALD